MQPYALPPFTAAKMIHTLTSLYGRRVDLNLITGASPEELLQIGDAVNHDQRYDRAVEYARVVRDLLSSDEPYDLDGRFHRYRDLKTASALKPDLRPRVFVAGASPAGRAAAAAVGDVAVTHPEPVEQFAAGFLAGRSGDSAAGGDGDGPSIGIRVGLFARPTAQEAWEEARIRFAGDRYTRLKTAMRRKSDSEWSSRLATLHSAADTWDEVYFTGAYASDKGSAPLLVGSYESVAGYLARYLDLGVRTVLLGSVYSPEEFDHVDRVLRLLR
jgi:alkanesulfonate monooxygenase SsuD/methylene tetrahydromethanopterin reductase-like flavin-dependent oxidoreductase (luciferase family)